MRLNENLMATEVSSVDTTSVATKSDPIPSKDLSPIFCRNYIHKFIMLDNDIRSELFKDVFKVSENKHICRWAMNKINRSMRITETCGPADKAAQWAMNHCGATLSLVIWNVYRMKTL